jgi:hypothetical protein
MLSPFYAQRVHKVSARPAHNSNACRAKKTVEMGSWSSFCGSGDSPSHDTTMKRIGWRVTPAVNLGGDDRGRGCARSRLQKAILQMAGDIACPTG